MQLKVKGGTTNQSGPSLCHSCRRAFVVRGDSLERTIICQQIDKVVRMEVRECNTYDDKSSPSLGDMRDAAWILRTDPKKNKIGFTPYRKLDNQEKADVNQDLPDYA